jgi:hypothetical protein
MTGTRTGLSSVFRQIGIFVCVAAALSASARSVHAVVKIFDGFGDADVNNNGTAAEAADTDVSGGGTGSVGSYVAVGNGGSPAIFPTDTMVNEVTAATDPSDVGIKWFSISGFSGTTTLTPRVSVHILDDSAGVLPETNPTIGYYSTPAGTTKYATALGSGLALAAEAKGRANQAAGFFNSQIQLGTAVNDTVKVSFDFRVWFSAPNFNDSGNPPTTTINHVPEIGELRFGLYEDTDHQLGQTNTVAGPGSTPAVWGQANGNFRGDNGTVGAQGDHGWFVRVPIDNPDTAAFDKSAGGADARINEETNDQAAASDKRIFNGAADFVARPPVLDPQFVNLDPNRAYNLSLELKRYDDPATAGNTGDTIYATARVIDKATNQQWSFGNFEAVLDGVAPNGISSDKWDYFVMGLAGSTDSDDFDWLIDNFKVEVTGSNAGVDGDFNNDTKVNAADYPTWRKIDGTGGGYVAWRENFSTSSGSASNLEGSAVPEPDSAVLLIVSALIIVSVRSRKAATMSDRSI